MRTTPFLWWFLFGGSFLRVAGSVVESRMEHEQMTGDVEEEHRLQVSPEELKVIRETLLDRSLTMAQRYRSVFTLRNIGGDEAISILAECMPCLPLCAYRRSNQIANNFVILVNLL